MKQPINLNEIIPDNDGNFPDICFLDNSIKTNEIDVFFRNIKDHLISEIKKAEIILGCVAWITDIDVINELKNKKVSIIVQKEDFLRPDLNVNGKKWKEQLRKRYELIQPQISRYSFSNILDKVSICTTDTIDSFRCVGNWNCEKEMTRPRMHNKFIVFARSIPPIDSTVWRKIEPYAVWTGSFNVTGNASNSLENAVLIRNKTIVESYLKEYEQICTISEPLNWEVEWTQPEWRIGT